MTTTARITIYPDPELKERIEAIRIRERRSLNAQVLMLLERAVQLEEQGVSVGMDDRVFAHVELPTAAKRKKRTGPCVHRIAADQFCKICDANV